MTTEEIHEICLKYNITNYTINDDLSIDVDDDVRVYDKYYLEIFSLKFRNITGSFYCYYCNLTSLKGSPSSVEGFYCYGNPLESLDGIPLNLKEEFLTLPDHFTYSDYIAYCRNLKFEKILK